MGEMLANSDGRDGCAGAGCVGVCGAVSGFEKKRRRECEEKRRRFTEACRADGLPVVASERFRQRGFTLLEVLLATALLAAGLAIGFATLRAAIATAQRGEEISQRSERMRSVERFLRERLQSALPMGFGTDKDTGMPIRFIGEPQRIRFVADLPDYLGRGGPYLHDIHVANVDGAQRLVVDLKMIVAGAVIEDPKQAPESLVPQLKHARFLYRGLDENNRLAGWTTTWKASDQLPVQVAVDLGSAGDDAWPQLVVTLPQASNGGLFQ